VKLKERLYDIDRARGLAIFLVVYGHLIADVFPSGNLWYETSNIFVYKFHMPFFMFLSGFTLMYAYKGVNNISQYRDYAHKKIVRIFPAFLLFALIIMFGKAVASQFLHVENVPGNFWLDLFYVLVRPYQSEAGSLWYIYALLEFSLLFPVLILIVRSRVEWLLPFGLIVYFVETTSYFLIDRLCEYMLFIAIGMNVVVHFEKYTRVIDRYRWFFYLFFVLSFFLVDIFSRDAHSKLVIGILSIPAIHALMRRPFMKSHAYLITWGGLSFSIYLMNTIVIGTVRGFGLKFLEWGGSDFLILAPILLLSGLFVPMLLKKRVFPLVPLLDRITN
jgi:peptidoglycan/LPS O-acetylase OafA/YrhL